MNQEINIRPLQGECCDNWRVSLSDRCQEVAAWADTHYFAEQTEPTEHTQTEAVLTAAMSLAETGVLSTRTGLSLVQAVLSIIRAPRGILLSCSEKRLDALCETCHSKTVFHYTAIKYLLCFLILAWQFDKNALCEKSCGWYGNIGCCNNCFHRKIGTNQMYQQEVNN